MDSEDGGHIQEPELRPLQAPKVTCKTTCETVSRLRQLRGRSLLLRYLKGGDWLLLCAGTVFALLHGVGFPLVTLILGHMTDILLAHAAQRCNNSNSSSISQYDEDIDEELTIENLLQNTSTGFINPQQFIDILSPEPGTISQEEFEDFLTLLSTILGGFVLVAAFLQPFCLDLCSSRQVKKLRQDLFHQLLRQEMAWYDYRKDKDVATQLCNHVDQFQLGTGNRLGMFLQYSVTCVAAFIVAFTSNWRLTLFILPLMFLCLVAPSILSEVYLNLTLEGYTEAEQVAEEVIGNIQSGYDTDGHNVELNCYREALQAGQKTTLRKHYGICSVVLAIYLLVNAFMAVALWQNWKLIEMGCLAPGAVATVFFSVIGGLLSINKVMAFGAAVLAAKKSAVVLKVIIDNTSTDNEGISRDRSQISGKVQFKDVSFSYPTAFKNQMLHNLSFDVEAGQNIAFLDVSGQVPTTVMDLLLGFYQPTTGKVLYDGSPRCPQNAISVLSFDPKLFTCLSVLDNIQLGQNDLQFNQMVQTAIDIGIHGYIPGLPLGYDTPVSKQFPGDLTQRIDLARVAVRGSRIILIDDITSHHVVEIQGNERLIEAFHRIMDGCTTIVLSRRVPIIQNASVIYVLENGVLHESGSHAELMEKSQLYYSYVKSQESKQEKNEDDGLRTTQQNGMDEKQRKTSEFILQLEVTKQGVLPDGSRCSMLCLNSPDWPWVILCLLGHLCTGFGLPVFARLFGDIFVPREELPKTSQAWGYMVLIVAGVVGFSFCLQAVSIATCIEKLLNRLRMQMFSALLHQTDGEIELNRDQLHHIHTQIIHELPSVRLVTVARICEAIGAATSLVAAMVAAFRYGWKMELVLLLVFPVIAVAFHFKTSTHIRHHKHRNTLLQPANKVMTECLQKIRTLRVLGGEEMLEELYSKKLLAPYHAMKKHATVYAIVYALAESGVHVLYAASFKFGFFLIRSELMGLVSVYRIFFDLGICIIAMSHLLIYRHEWVTAEDNLQKLFKLVKGESKEKEII